METKFTPGPWLCEPGGPFPYIVTQSPDFPHQQVADTCASVAVFNKDGKEEDHALANALLISAAPDLFAALEDALAGWRYIRRVHGDLSGVGWDRVEEAATAALRKATGETP